MSSRNDGSSSSSNNGPHLSYNSQSLPKKTNASNDSAALEKAKRKLNFDFSKTRNEEMGQTSQKNENNKIKKP